MSAAAFACGAMPVCCEGTHTTKAPSGYAPLEEIVGPVERSGRRFW